MSRRRSLILLAVASAIVLGTAIVLADSYPTARATYSALESVGSAVRQPVAFRSSQLVRFPLPAIEIRELAVGDSVGARIEARRVRLRLPLSALLTRELRVRTVEVEDIRITVASGGPGPATLSGATILDDLLVRPLGDGRSATFRVTRGGLTLAGTAGVDGPPATLRLHDVRAVTESGVAVDGFQGLFAVAADSMVGQGRGTVLGAPVRVGLGLRDPERPSAVIAVSGPLDLGHPAIGASADGLLDVDLRVQIAPLRPERSRAAGRVGVSGLRMADPALAVPYATAVFEGPWVTLSPLGIGVLPADSVVEVVARIDGWIPALMARATGRPAEAPAIDVAGPAAREVRSALLRLFNAPEGF